MNVVPMFFMLMNMFGNHYNILHNSFTLIHYSLDTVRNATPQILGGGGSKTSELIYFTKFCVKILNSVELLNNCMPCCIVII